MTGGSCRTATPQPTLQRTVHVHPQLPMPHSPLHQPLAPGSRLCDPSPPLRPAELLAGGGRGGGGLCVLLLACAAAGSRHGPRVPAKQG